MRDIIVKKGRGPNSAIPEWLRYVKGKNEKSPVWFLDLRGSEFSPESTLWQKKVNKKIEGVLIKAMPARLREPVLVKCHVGEKRCRTRMLPEYALSTVRYLRSRGVVSIAAGDTTVAYSGDRGYHDNHGDCSRYRALADRHGWTGRGPLNTPFVVLDRPDTASEGPFSFRAEEVALTPRSSRRFRQVFLSGGFAAAGTIINHVHLTLHDMAQVACAVKGITMGGSSYKGKLMMHKCYSPAINGAECKKCGSCAVNCPEKALKWEKGSTPELDGSRCIGCGECIAVCHGGSISMQTQEIEDWAHGSDSLPYRMADYVIGMMEGRWDRLLNIVHLYNITRRCDCVDKVQKPILPHIGFLIGRNPFAVDLMCNYLLQEELFRKVRAGSVKTGGELRREEMLKVFFRDYHGAAPFRHVQEEYGIVVEPKAVRVRLS
jgi:uncharacterized Fe-S center protein